MKVSDLPPGILALNPALAAEVSAPVPAAFPFGDVNRAACRCEGSEAELLRACQHELSRRNIAYLHLSPRARELAGWPDLVFAHPLGGRFAGVELKAAGGRLSQAQAAMGAQIVKNGGLFLVCFDFGVFLAFLDGPTA